MSRSLLRLCSLPLILLAVTPILIARTSQVAKTPPAKVPQAVYVETSVKSWTVGYANWISGRPDVVQAQQKDSGVQIMLRMPFLDYFASDGKSIYSNTSATANIEFLHKLPQSGQKKPPEGADLQPTVSDYLGMFPKLSLYKTQILARRWPVLLAICKDDTPNCADQNQALREFKSRATSLGIQVVEVKLLKTPPDQ